MRLPDLVSVGGENIAPTGGIFNRYLHLRGELGLSLPQINALADACQRYTEAVLGVFTEMTVLAGQIHRGLRRGRPLTVQEQDAVRTALGRRGVLARQAETLYVEAVTEGDAILTADQLALAEKLLGEERDAAWEAFERALGRAVGVPARL
ncbi:hypothetical protein [Frankia sp. ACN1ag]|uniref:hypothetical protein n=1 Tax=Frankia sp. ACN1ag TaxID=102891 RepID=UPI0006DCCFBF|nr:hypothetical protein [Frankia sp. ACN1ag]KQC34717.1 hypothetical protein UK82_30560 [Frankia sp. ACN1ag]